jgi:hypothetical protein
MVENVDPFSLQLAVFQGHKCGVPLGFDHQFGGQETLRLILGNVRSIYYVCNKLRPERQRHLIAINVSGFVLINEKEIVSLVLDGHVCIFANLDVAIGTENEQAPVSPGTKSIGSKPIQADITKAAISAQHHVAEILEPGMIRMSHVGDLRLNYLSFS